MKLFCQMVRGTDGKGRDEEMQSEVVNQPMKYKFLVRACTRKC